MLSRVFGKGSIYETLDLDDRRDVDRPGYDLYNSGLTHDDPQYSGMDPRTESFVLQSRGGHPTRSTRHHLPTNSLYPHYESTLPNLNEEDTNDDVPGSLLVEDHHRDNEPSHRQGFYEPFDPTREEVIDNMERGLSSPPPRGGSRTPDPTVWLGLVDPKERAMWKWANVENLDVFLQQVYGYYIGKGIYCIVLARFLNLAYSVLVKCGLTTRTIAFVVGFSTFLIACIDWSKIRGSHTLSEIIIPHGLSRISYTGTFVLWSFALFWMIKLFQYLVDLQGLRELQNFYYYLLEIRDVDIQTISWQEVVQKLMRLRDANPNTANHGRSRLNGLFSKQRMDAHDIANRIMRKDNYFIAMINRDVLDLTIPVPILNTRPLLTKILEWNINLCIMKYVFDDQGQLRSAFITDAHKRLLADGLKRRFIFAGFMNLIFAPFIVIYLLLLYFFRYFEEYHKNPGALSSRQYKPFAQWKFREFNELYHIFKKRLDFSHKFASKYIDQFPKEKTAQISSFVAFISGSFAAVLFLVSLVDPELFLGFEITKDRTVLFYLGLFGTILAVSRGMIPEENLVFEPEAMLTQVIEYTHYYPNHWNAKLHSDEVKREFSSLYDLKIMIFLEEVLSVLTTPFILWFSLPNSSEKVVDFFREFTVHVDGIGYVCSFAVFDFKRHGKHAPARGSRQLNRDERTNQKMEQSIMNFRTIHPDWMPGDIDDDDSSAYVNRVNDPLRSVNAYRMGVTNARRPSQQFLGFAASSHVGQSSRVDQSRAFIGQRDGRSPPRSPAARRHQPILSPGARSTGPQAAESDLLREMDERLPEEKFDSELGDSFMTPSQAVEDAAEDPEGGSHGVLGLLNHLYQETGTGKGIGM